MGKNHMKEVAQLLGVELEEKFKVKDEDLEDYVYKFTSECLLTKPNGRDIWLKSELIYGLLNGTYEIEKPILTEQEKEYLSAVIKPFRDRVIYIKKRSGYRCEYLIIAIKIDDDNNEFTGLPSFKICTMYKAMELNKEYSLEDLGI